MKSTRMFNHLQTVKSNKINVHNENIQASKPNNKIFQNFQTAESDINGNIPTCSDNLKKLR